MASIEISDPVSLPSAVNPTPNHAISSTTHTINIGTRKSLLARVQTDTVVSMLKEAWPGNEYVVHAISTIGDKNQITALHDFGAKSLWTHELEAMLVKHEVDFIIHCLKDIPTQLPPNLIIGAILPRTDPRDAVVLHPSLPPHTSLSSLPANSTIGTSSVRRSAQLKRLYPHLRFQSVRGNVGTRLSKLDRSDLALSCTSGSGSKLGEATTADESADAHYSALILAAAGLLRLDLGDRISRYLSSQVAEDPTAGSAIAPQKGILYAVGQGALALEIREGDESTAKLIAPLACRATALSTLAERSLMRTLEGGCSVPIGVETEWADAETLVMRAIVVSVDGRHSVEASKTGHVSSEAQADEFGWQIARTLVDMGAEEILKGINLDRKIIEGQGDA